HHYQYTVSDRFSGSVFSAYSRNLTLHELYSLPTLSNRMRAASRSVAGTPPSRPRSLWVLVQAHRHVILYGIPGNGLLYYSGQSFPVIRNLLAFHLLEDRNSSGDGKLETNLLYSRFVRNSPFHKGNPVICGKTAVAPCHRSVRYP